MCNENDHRRDREWKLFFLLPRLFFRSGRGGNVHQGKLAQRFQEFSEDRWSELLRVSRQSAEDASKTQSRKRRPQCGAGVGSKGRQGGLAQLGGLSSGRQALEGACVAPGTRHETQRFLRLLARARARGDTAEAPCRAGLENSVAVNLVLCRGEGVRCFLVRVASSKGIRWRGSSVSSGCR